MTINPSPFVLTTVAKQRQEAFLAESDRDRLARLAQGSGTRQRRSGLGPIVGIAVALALLTVSTVAEAPASQPLAALSEAANSVATCLLAADAPEVSAVQKVREAAWAETGAAESAVDADLA